MSPSGTADARRARRSALGLSLTLVAVGLSHAMAYLAGREATLQRLAIVVVLAAAVLVASQWGRLPGLLAGALGGAYAVLFFLVFGTHELATVRLSVGAVVGAFILGLAFLVGTLRTRVDKASARALDAEREKTRALQAHAAELAEANAGLARANDALRAVNESLEAFSYVVAHDLKEPVRGIAALLEDAEREAIRPQVRQNVHAARMANQRLARLLTGLLEVARASQVDPHDLKPVYPLEMLESDDCTERYAALRDERGARVEGACLLGTPPVLATEAHMCQILGNLVLNAIKHNDKTPPLVRVRVQPQDADATMVLVSVEDDGPGLPPHADEHVGRVRPGRPITVHGGFGILIVRRAVERLGGKVWFGRSPDLGGAAVYFTLPAATQPPRQPPSAAPVRA